MSKKYSPTTKVLPRRPAVYLGIDPGTTRIGYGVIQDVGGIFTCLDYGIVDNPGRDRIADFTATHHAIQTLIVKHRPVASAVEKLFFFKNHKTIMPVGEMRGVIMLAIGQTGTPIYEQTPLQVKKTICNYGMADKKQVQRMVQTILRLEKPIQPDDAADALALAICAAVTHTQ